MIVTKFGGTSMANAAQFCKVREIVKSDPSRRAVVVSAPGRRFSGDTKVTDLLYTLYMHLQYDVPYKEIWDMITERYLSIAQDLRLSSMIEGELEAIHAQLCKRIDQNYLISRGEYLAARLMSEFLGFDFVDAKDIIRFSYDGTVNREETERSIQDMGLAHDRIVVPGFYGAYPNGEISLFSRGGSDITGAYLTGGLGAELYENWTDVSGVLAADPRIVDNPKIVPQVTYAELRELSYMGANVLHEESVAPVQDHDLCINIRNTNDPAEAGTMIRGECTGGTVITGITGTRNFVSFDISKAHMANEIGFIRKVLDIFEQFKINIEHLPTGIDTVSVIVSGDSVSRCLYDIVSRIEKNLDARVSVRKGIALIAIVGRNMAGKSGVSAKIFSSLATAEVNVKMIAQSSDEMNIIVGLDNNDYELAVRTLYSSFCECGWI